MNSNWTLADLRAQPVTETDPAIPGWQESRVYKDSNRYDGVRTDFGYQLVHSSLPPPAAGSLTNLPQAVDPSAPKIKPAVFGVYNGRSFTLAQPMDVSRLSMDQILDEFNRAVPNIGGEVSK
jgi:hypothetical protein